MDNSNKAIARRINKELKVRGWGQADLLKSIIKFKNPNYSKSDIYYEMNAKKGNFSTSLKGKGDRSIPKEDLYIIAKVLGVSLEYLWFGDEQKSGFIPQGARYVAYQDSDDAYRTYIAGLEYEDKVQYGDEFGFSLFDYLGQFDSINGYRFFVKNYNLSFDYVQYGQLIYKNSEGHQQSCSHFDKDYGVSYNLIRVLAKYDDIKTFKTIYFDNCSMARFNPDGYYLEKNYFSDDFLKELIEKESFLELTMKTKMVEMSQFNKAYDKNEKRNFVEPMFFEALDYALKHESEYHAQLEKMLNYALEYSKSQYEFIKDYLKENKETEYGDVSIDRYAPRFLRSSRNYLMGNIIRVKETTTDESINKLINEIGQHNFNMSHIINEQEKNNEEIKISNPNNSLFTELLSNAIKQKADYIPTMTYSNDEFIYFRYYDSTKVDTNNSEQLRTIVNALNESQNLVKVETGKVLVHGNLHGQIVMVANGKPAGLAGWQRCHYGDKYEDRAELLSRFDDYYYDVKYLAKYKEAFEVLSIGFNKEEQNILIDKAIDILNKQIDMLLKEDKDNTQQAFRIKERVSKLEFFKKVNL